MISFGYLLRRLIMAIVVILSVSILTFLASRLLPSDPAALFAGPRPTVDQIAAARERLGLDQPLWRQYLEFLKEAVSGDFGISFRTKHQISVDIASFLPATLELILAAMLIAICFGVPLGVISSARPKGWIDQSTRILAIGGVSFPPFWLAMILQLVFFRWLGWLPLAGRVSKEISLFNPIEPVTGFNTIDSVIQGNWQGLGDSLWHLVLPAATLSIYPVSLAIRMTRSSMVEALGERYITAAMAMGHTKATILFRLALKNALAPTLTVLGLSFAFSLTGAFLIEIIFAWPGLGMYVTQAILDLDFPVIMAVTLVATVFYVVVNVCVDFAQAALDPRIALQ